MDTMTRQLSRKLKRVTVLFTVLFISAILILISVMYIKSTTEQQSILEESVRAQLISTSIAARQLIDPQAYVGYNSVESMDTPAYRETVRQLRQLASQVGADYIYTLKRVGSDYHFIFDTDTEDETPFEVYDPSDVHLDAFAGISTAGLQNVQDEYGSFNTGAVPLWLDGQIIGVVSTDISDVFYAQSQQTARRNAILLVVTLVVAMLVMVAVVYYLMHRVKQMQDRLERLAHFDQVTGMPNRQYLMDYLDGITTGKTQCPFALLFVDLDNFKRVNDTEGHDAGDRLLREIGSYLEGALENTISFRPPAGRLNIAARLGGDEFVQIISGISTLEEAATAAHTLLEGFSGSVTDPVVARHNVGFSVGVALYPLHSEDYNELITFADIAMYVAKKSGKNQYRIYDSSMGTETPEDVDCLR